MDIDIANARSLQRVGVNKSQHFPVGRRGQHRQMLTPITPNYPQRLRKPRVAGAGADARDGGIGLAGFVVDDACVGGGALSLAWFQRVV